MIDSVRFIQPVTAAELKRGIEVSEAAKHVPIPKFMGIPELGIAITDNVFARMHVGLIEEFGDKASAISLRLSVLARAAVEGLGEHFVPPNQISEEAIEAVAEMMIVESRDPGAAGILAAIEARRGRR
jgi:hypothetical protein